MSATLTVDASLTARVQQLLGEMDRTEGARPPIEAEIAGEMARLDVLVVRAEASSSWWLPESPQVTPAGLSDSIAGALMLIAPTETRKITAARVKRRCAAWRGMRLAEGEKAKRLAKLAADLKVARAKVEQARRRIEEQTLEVMMPRTGPLDHPEIWLMVPAELDALAATGSGRQR